VIEPIPILSRPFRENNFHYRFRAFLNLPAFKSNW